jgi:signal transduction histidine kinase
VTGSAPFLDGWGIRGRVATVAAVVFTVLLVLWGTGMWAVLGDALQSTARNAATATVLEVAAGLKSRPPAQVVPTLSADAGERVVQVVGPDDVVLASSRLEARDTPISDLAPPTSGVRTAQASGVPGIDGDSFVIAVLAAHTTDGQEVRVIAAEPEHVEESTLAWLTFLLGLGALALLLTMLWAVRSAIGAALRPVETMRSQVAEISSAGSDTQVAVPGGGDELTALGTTMNQMLDRLRESDRARRSFVADAGHELRNPLTTIRLALDRAAAANLPTAERQEVIDRARDETERLSTLVHDLLTLATFDEQGGRHRHAQDLLDLDDIVLTRVRLARDAGIPVRLSLEPVQVRGDSRHLERVVANLLDNAARHRAHEVRVFVHRLTRHTASAGENATGDLAVVRVDNDGPPVPEADRERVFARFQRLDEIRHRDTGGTGLGLAIVAEIVHAHDGTVTATEAPDGWCRFEVTVPAASSAL